MVVGVADRLPVFARIALLPDRVGNEVLAAEDLVEKRLAVMRLAIIEVDEDCAILAQKLLRNSNRLRMKVSQVARLNRSLYRNPSFPVL